MQSNSSPTCLLGIRRAVQFTVLSSACVRQLRSRSFKFSTWVLGCTTGRGSMLCVTSLTWKRTLPHTSCLHLVLPPCLSHTAQLMISYIRGKSIKWQKKPQEISEGYLPQGQSQATDQKGKSCSALLCLSKLHLHKLLTSLMTDKAMCRHNESMSFK